ncbi:MAG: hypothetical protein K6E33_01145 [Lachnospiraceae bacterium]|nr:hypothetical protein [Lachnospiraceae bacterium]
MEIKCDFCDNIIKDTDEKCPFCGAPNAHVNRTANREPKTIEELRAYCRARNMPLEKMRFFIGEDYKGPKAFGLFKDDEGMYVVYKNKADGNRAVRYRGKDEAYAVNEIYQKLKTEISQQIAGGHVKKKGSKPSSSKGGGGQKRSGIDPDDIKSFIYKRLTSLSTYVVLIFVLILVAIILDPSPVSGYYNADDSYYYYDSTNGWYGYNDYDDYWYKTDAPEISEDSKWSDYSADEEEFEFTYGDQVYTFGDYRADNSEDFTTKSYSSDDDDDDYDYDNGFWDDWDDDYDDYDWGGWDSNDTDWDSDW